MRRAGCRQATFRSVSQDRREPRQRQNRPLRPASLVLASPDAIQRKELLHRLPAKPIIDADLLNQVARLSPAANGPRKAVEFLAEQGIAVEIVPHLPRTHLDGAAMKSAGGRPVIGLTLRYDRIDNFWWVLMHELAHVVKHLPQDR